MATASRVHLTPSLAPQLSYSVETITPESAEKTSRLLQLNHEQHHVYFNHEGFHNHIVHHLLTLFALGAPPSQLQKAYDINAPYQRPAEPISPSIITSLHDPSSFRSHLGKEKHYHSFLVFFQQEIDAKGWEQVLQEYLFSGTEVAEDLLVRMYAGFLHPIIHLGFGVEFKQPAIVAEALAQGAVHDSWIGELFVECERKVGDKKGKTGEKKSIMQILEECRKDEKVRESARFSDANKIRDGIMKRAKEEMVAYAAQYVVEEEDVERATAEMIDAAVYFAAAAQRPPQQVKFDFFFIHCVNSSIFFSAFLSPSSGLSPANQRRLLQWKIWIDITMYVSRGSPELLRDEIENYVPKHNGDMQGVIERVRKIEDDGHACKLVRAILNAEKVSRDRGQVTGDMWRKVGHMAVDSVEAGEPMWVRSCGFEKAWENVPLRDGARL
ncbi:hypothetical protein yc1106_00281 [Curvularia clavata]|uniref:Uncharacterized protein n=1 Tax=Curvularia clavata TaxID=95742 RepID=A0A9Q8YZU2_CURCL|nr:hypothetical protein yc1106_00281 [Curvularia clavata]